MGYSPKTDFVMTWQLDLIAYVPSAWAFRITSISS